jgi:hypothetical protein
LLASLAKFQRQEEGGVCKKLFGFASQFLASPLIGACFEFAGEGRYLLKNCFAIFCGCRRARAAPLFI